MTDPTAPRPPDGGGEALRLTYSYDADGVRLLSQQRVDVAVQVARPATAGHVVDGGSAQGDGVWPDQA
jgi:hypothetical protein